ncbi:polysaccharide biosynthesis protein [Flavobacterium chuncheonense]|uniref:Polysaccharide biosynthesis protein n=1 Tax=Flavobacterium chuncheonense TaxID=2026653 RepID=A0ABW5YJ06_9FLAO
MSETEGKKYSGIDFKTFGKSFFTQRFSNLGYLPRWIIFTIDVGIVMLSCTLTYLIVSNLTLSFYNSFSIPVRYAFMLLVNISCFLVFRTYAGIIRHSSFVDALKLLFATGTSLAILTFVNYLHYFVFGTKIYLFPGLVVNAVISFVMLFVYRVLVKYMFEHYLNRVDKNKQLKVVIYGSDANAVALANVLAADQLKKYRLMGFLEKRKSRVEKQMLGLPIIHYKNNTAVVLRALKADGIIIADRKLSKKDKLRIVEECLENKFKVLTLPAVTDWEDQEQIAKSIKKFDINDLLERQPIALDNLQIASQISGKVILITGAAGSIGSEIVQQVLLFNPKKVILLDQAESPLHDLVLNLRKNGYGINVVPIVADIKDEILLHHIFETHQPELVYHAAAYKHVPLMEDNPYQAVMNNVIGTKNLADCAVRFGVSRFVMVSTDKAVNPSNVMGASKRIAELYVQSLYFEKGKAAGIKFITTRFGNVLGSNGSVVPLFTKQIEEGGPITITHPEIIRYFMTIPEACQLVLEAGAMGNGGEIYIFDMGKPVKIIDLAKKMIQLAGLIPNKEIEIKITGLRPGEKLYEELLNDSSKTLPTHHDKIMIAIDAHDESYELIENKIAELKHNTLNLDMEATVRVMKDIVPEFKSLNSNFASLDVV